MNAIISNTNNLTSLWTLGGKTAGKFFTNDDFSISVVSNSEWPNKLWFHKVPDSRIMDSILDNWDMRKITIPIWAANLSGTEEVLKDHGFIMKNELTGMAVRLDSTISSANKFWIEKVNDYRTAIKWSKLFQKCFGYLIHSETVEKTMDAVDYFIGRFEYQSVGTAALYLDNTGIAGLHSMGIVPDHRRNGFAEDFMVHLLNTARHDGAKYATLQASAMGKGIYLRAGFKEDFQLKNFIKQ